MVVTRQHLQLPRDILSGLAQNQLVAAASDVSPGLSGKEMMGSAYRKPMTPRTLR